MSRRSERRTGLEDFSRLTGQPLRPYQRQAARAIVRSVLKRQGRTFTVMMGRQMGKNELSAQLEAYLLFIRSLEGGTVIKAAPTFKPQLITSKMRLERVLAQLPPKLTEGLQSRFGYIVQWGAAAIHFLSADVGSNVVGATADLLLEIDEAQDVSEEKYLKDFRPMASTANTTAVLYGTAWSEDTLLARQRSANLRDDPEAHFELPWTVLAELNPSYGEFVQAEMRRLGPDHPIIRTQYQLETIDGAGKLLNAEQLQLLQGVHRRLASPDESSEFWVQGSGSAAGAALNSELGTQNVIYVAGVDIAGEDEVAADEQVRRRHPKRDSTVVTIARVTHPPSHMGEPLMEVVQHYWWTGRDHSTQYGALFELLQARWRCVMVCADATGVGAGVTSWLARAMPGRLEGVQFTRPAKSEMGYELLAAINGGRLRMYAGDGSAECREFWDEARLCRSVVLPNTAMNFFVDDKDGHDDFVVSLALCVRAAAQALPEPAGGIVLARRLYQDGLY